MPCPTPPVSPASPRFPLARRQTSASGLDILAVAATESPVHTASHSCHSPGPYNPAAALPPKVVKKVLDLDFVEMAELRADIWPDDSQPAEGAQSARRPPAKPPVTDIKVWLDCYSRMAALLSTRFPQKAPELWAYQATIVKAAHNYEGASWVAYDRQFRRDMLARKDLNWSTPNSPPLQRGLHGKGESDPPVPPLPQRGSRGTAMPP